MLGVSSCITEELLQQDKEVLEASRMTKWNSEKQKSEHTNMVKVVLVEKHHPVRFTRGYGSFRMWPFVRTTTVLQLPEVWPPGQDLQVWSKYQTTKTNSKELNTKNNAEQEVGNGKGGIRPTTNHQCRDKTLRNINNRVSDSSVSEPDKTAPFRTIGQSIPTSQQATNKTPTKRGRTNGRCTGNNTYCTHQCNISIKEDFYREHSSST